jgi:Type I restriction modification DNA specificity domain
MSDKLPTVWTTALLSDLLIELESGSRPRGGVRGIAQGVPSIGGEHVKYDGSFDFSAIKYVSTAFAARMTKGHIEINDILVVKDGATTGKTAFVDANFPFRDAVVNEHVFICRPIDKIEPRFLFRFLMSKNGQDRILENFKGSAQGGINKSFASNTEVPLAPPNEQRRIVAKLEKLLQKLDSCQKRLAKIPILLERFRESVLAAGCHGQLTEDWRKNNHSKDHLLASSKQGLFKLTVPPDDLAEIPETWNWVPLGNYGRCSRGRFSVRPRNDPNYYGGRYPFIQIGDLRPEGGWIGGHTQTLNERGLQVSKSFPKGTVVIAIVGATIGNTGILPYDMCFPDSLVGIETGTAEGNRYVNSSCGA